MFRFPYFGFQYPYYNRYYNMRPYPKNQNITTDEKISQSAEQTKRDITNPSLFSNIFSPMESIDNDQVLFEIFGIKLYLDDIIILGLLMFLYQEKVNDEMLYIVLFLLLFS